LPIKILVDQIRPKGLHLEETLIPEDLGVISEIVTFQGGILAKADAQRIDDVVRVAVHVDGDIRWVCSRCLKEFPGVLNKDFILDYPVERRVRTIVLDEDIRDNIMLDYPMAPLCADDCRGLCPHCGGNRNDGKCRCK
jgi:uncharacterized protein